jgi:Flp pilus assembly protein TadG
MRNRTRCRLAAQALVEFAVAVPIFLVLVLGTIQLSLAAIWFYSQTVVARDAARWLAIRPNSSDATVAEQVRQILLPGMLGGSPMLVASGTTTSDTTYRVGNMITSFTPCLATGNPPTCTHPDRAPGATLRVTVRYDAANIFFLPTTFRIGSVQTTLPTTLPSYTVYVMAE